MLFSDTTNIKAKLQFINLHYDTFMTINFNRIKDYIKTSHYPKKIETDVSVNKKGEIIFDAPYFTNYGLKMNLISNRGNYQLDQWLNKILINYFNYLTKIIICEKQMTSLLELSNESTSHMFTTNSFVNCLIYEMVHFNKDLQPNKISFPIDLQYFTELILAIPDLNNYLQDTSFLKCINETFKSQKLFINLADNKIVYSPTMQTLISKIKTIAFKKQLDELDVINKMLSIHK